MYVMLAAYARHYIQHVAIKRQTKTTQKENSIRLHLRKRVVSNYTALTAASTDVRIYVAYVKY